MRLICGFLLLSLIAFSCRLKHTDSTTKNSSNVNLDVHHSRNSLDWAGVYSGILPCADCEGIQTMVKLNQNLTYRKHQIYVGKSDELFESEGKFSWDSSGNVIQLEGENSGMSSRYALGENKLTQLDAQGSKIEGDLAAMYELEKMESGIREKYWKLLEVFGTSVNWEDGFEREPHMILKRDDNKIRGNGSCNVFSGNYELKEDNIINISQLASTRKMCPNMKIETSMLKALEEASRYDVMGDTLRLFGENDQLIAKFEAVYFR